MTGKRRHDPETDPNRAILDHDVGKRLDAIVRRFGGKPKPVESIGNKVTLPAPKRGHRKGQLAFMLPLPGYRTPEPEQDE